VGRWLLLALACLCCGGSTNPWLGPAPTLRYCHCQAPLCPETVTVGWVALGAGAGSRVAGSLLAAWLPGGCLAGEAVDADDSSLVMRVAPGPVVPTLQLPLLGGLAGCCLQGTSSREGWAQSRGAWWPL